MADKQPHDVSAPGADPGAEGGGVWFTEDAAAAAKRCGTWAPGSARSPRCDDERPNLHRQERRRADGAPRYRCRRAGLGFEYAGDLDALRDRLAAAGHTRSA